MASIAKRDGKWTVRHLDRTGAHRQKTFTKKKDADAFKAKVENDKANGIDQLPTSAVTVDRLSQEFLAARRQMVKDGSLSFGTLERETYALEKLIAPLIGTIAVQVLAESDVDKAIRTLRAKDCAWRDRKLSAVTVRQAIVTLAAVLDYGRRRKIVRENVAREVLSWAEHRPGAKRRVRTFTIEQMRALVVVLETRRPWQMERSVTLGRAAIYLAAFCGLRFGEVFGLTRANVDLERGIVRVRTAMGRDGKLKGPKTSAGVRDVPMPQAVASAVAEWIEAYHVPNKGDLVFTTKKGIRMLPTPFHRDIWHPLMEKIGLGPDDEGETMHFHALRHFFASMMVKRFALPDVAQLMGHASFDMTLSTYAHPLLEVEHRHVGVAEMAGDILAPSL